MEKTVNGQEDKLANIKGFVEANTYREQRFQDSEAGWLEVRWPVKFTGEPDPDRTVLFHGQTILGGRINLTWPIEALDLPDAFAKWRAGCVKSIQEFQEQQTRAALAAGAAEANMAMKGGKPLVKPR